MSVEPHPVTYVTRLPKHRHICFWAFVLIILVGVVSIAAGVALFASPTDRELRVDEYNRAVDEYNNGIMRSLALNWSGTVNGVAVKVKLQPVPYVGDPTDIREAVSVVAVASVDTGVGAYSWNLSPNFPSFSSAFTLTGTNLYNMYCDRQNCASGCTDPAAYHCTAASITATCRTLFGSQASYYGSDCDAGGYCGGCSYSMYLANQCFVASYAATTATWTILNQSCFTPFTDTPTLRLSSGRTGLYTSVQPASVTSVMRTSDDPRLLMQTMTGGSMDFGPPEYTGLSRRGYATVIVTVGAFVTLTGVGLLVWFTCFREPTTMSRTPSLDEDEDAPLPPSHLHTGAMYPTPSTSVGSTPVPYLGPHHQGVTDAV